MIKTEEIPFQRAPDGVTVELFRHDTYAEIRAVDSQSDLRILL